MLQQIRFALLSALVILTTIPLGACDIFGGDDPGPVVAEDSLQIASVTPDVGADLDSAAAEITITFTRSVVENDYTRTDVEPGNGSRYLVDEIGFFPVRAKDLTPSGSVPFEIEFEDDRTQLTITTLEDLQDGFVYNLDLGNPVLNTGFYDSRFKSAQGGRYVENPNLDENLDFTYSVGLSEGRPATPSISIADQDFDSETIADEGELDYTDFEPTAELQVDEVDNSGAEVKGYEVYYKSQDQRAGSGSNDQFVKATDVSPEASPTDYEDWQGIIPADAAFQSGSVGFTVDVDDWPLAAKNGSYGPIEWKVRAVSVNNARGDFSNVLTTGDNTLPRLSDADAGPENDDGDVVSILVEFSEPLDGGTVSTARFTVEDNLGDPVGLDSANLTNVQPDQSGTTTVELVLDSPTGSVNNYSVEVDDDDTSDPVLDLAGNGVNPVFDSDTV